jgi:dihydropteroate synthase
MGIINVTPDSFSDGGQLLDPKTAIDAGVQMAEDGADLLDIGGESTRPGAQPTPEGEERRRILPVIEALASRVQVPISVDTYKASTADAALSAGAAMVNDVSGLRYEPDLASVVAKHGVPIVLMHTRGRSRDMYQQAVYSEVVDEVLDEVRESMAFAAGAGIPREHMLVDPGLGFAKEAPHSFEVLSRLHQFAELGRPIVVGPSRKTFLTKPMARQSDRLRDSSVGEARAGVAKAGQTAPPHGGDGTPVSRDWATTAAVTAAVLCGAHIVRVHAVRELAEVVRVADEIRKYHRDV